jgi:hypothetical protein
MDGMMCSTVNDWDPESSSIVDVNCPESHDSKRKKVAHMVHRKNENEDVIWAAL